MSGVAKKGKASGNSKLLTYKNRYELVDKAGRFTVYREAGKTAKKNDYAVKTQVYGAGNPNGDVLEQSVVISTPGSLGGKLPILRPKASQYLVFLDKKKYISQLKLDVENRSLSLKVDGPDGVASEFNGTRKIPFPKGTGIYCFFSGLMECVGATGFIKKAIAERAGAINLHVIWDGYPYFQQQYVNLPNEVFTPARLTFSGSDKGGSNRFSLDVAGQVIFYFTSGEGKLSRIFWVSQGVSLVSAKEM